MAGEKVLLVEDEPLNRELFRDLLEVEGYLVTEATDARAAIEEAKASKFELILMDVQLPGMDGLAATRLIRQESKNKATPIVALTAYAMKGDKERIEAAGCDGYVTKPIKTGEFRETVARFVKASRK